MRSCLIGTALAREMGLPEEEVSDVFFTALLLHVAAAFGNVADLKTP